MSTKKKAPKFEYKPQLAVEMVRSAERKKKFDGHVAEHNALLDTFESIDVVNIVGDRESFTPAALKEKYNVGIDSRPDAINMFVLADKLSYGVYVRQPVQPDGLIVYKEVDINARTLTAPVRDLSEAIAYAEAEESTAVNDFDREFVDCAPKTADTSGYTDTVDGGFSEPRIEGDRVVSEFKRAEVVKDRVITESLETMLGYATKMADIRNGDSVDDIKEVDCSEIAIRAARNDALKADILAKHNLMTSDIFPSDWLRKLSSHEVLSSKHMDDKQRAILQARVEYQACKGALKEDFTSSTEPTELSDKVEIVARGRGNVPGLIHCNEFGTPFEKLGPNGEELELCMDGVYRLRHRVVDSSTKEAYEMASGTPMLDIYGDGTYKAMPDIGESTMPETDTINAGRTLTIRDVAENIDCAASYPNANTHADMGYKPELVNIRNSIDTQPTEVIGVKTEDGAINSIVVPSGQFTSTTTISRGIADLVADEIGKPPVAS